MFTLQTDTTSSKPEFYHSLNLQLSGLLTGEDDLICNLSQFAAFLMQSLEEVNWAGVYFAREEELVLGPYVGKVACTRIPFGRGVCGTAASTQLIQRVANVNEFAGHIACDSESESEIVLPIVVDGQLMGVLDIDSPVNGRFDDEDQAGIEGLLKTLIQSTRFEWQL
mgnify:CR=1 FL=1|jgi:GAF domain-containing protein